MRACKYCMADTELEEGICHVCWETIDRAKPSEIKEMELWQS